ncbi:MAG TPA: response regulator transcription factor, partial [Patescibacteria group bacterium]|nr:response regulator transcription factor [Patescibacteria group bacterium]
RKTDAGVILLADCGGKLDGVCGLEMGADDCVSVPFNPRELRARVRNLVAKTRALRQMGSSISANSLVRFGGWEFDLDRRQLLSPQGEPARLTGGEFALLAALIANPGRVLSREWLLEQISSKGLASTSRSVDVCIAQLRRKLADDPRCPALIITVHGVGYRFSAEVT